MGFIGARVGQHGFKIRHQFNDFFGAAGVVQQHGAQFGVVFGADQHGDARTQVVTFCIELNPVGHETGLVSPARQRCRCGSEGADPTLPDLAQIKKAAITVAQHVVAPARDVAALPAADACATGAQGDVVTPVGQQMRGFPAGQCRIDVARVKHGRAALAVGLGRQARVGAFNDLARRAFVQQGFMRGHLRLGAKPAPGCVIAQHVAQRHQRHALVVGHEGLNDVVGLLFRLTRQREVQRFKQAQVTARAQFFKPHQVGDGRCGLEQCGQHGGIRGNHPIGQRGAPQRQAWHAKGRILVGQ